MSASGVDGAAGAELRARLRRASRRELLDLVGEHLRAMTMREVRQLLLNPHVDGEVIDQLIGTRHLGVIYAFQAAVARHHRTRETSALRFVPRLFWRDLMEIGLDSRLRPAVRRTAERYLLLRLPRLSVGEKISLARRASREILAVLRHDPSPVVVKALLENPRLSEEVLLPLASSRQARPQVLRALARDPRWGSRPEICAALARNPSTPASDLCNLLVDLRRDDLLAVADLEEHTWIVRHRAREILENPPRAADDSPEAGQVWYIL